MNTSLKTLLLIPCIAFLTGTALLAQTGSSPIKKERFHLNKEVEDAIGYTMAVKVGNTLYISGNTSGGDAQSQIKNVYEGLQQVLENYGISFHHVVKENLYTTDIEGIKQHQEDRKKFYKGDFPAATWVEVRQLYDASLKLEVELIAVLP